MTQRPRTWSLNLYLAGFGLVSLLLMALLAWWILLRIDAMDRSLQAAEAAGAREELQHALHDRLVEMRKAARKLAAWDEVRQQFAQPAYYAYWRMHRLHKPGILPADVVASELYDHTGQRLGSFRDALLPARLPDPPRERVFLDTRHRLVIEQYQPVTDPDGRRLGWLGLRWALLPGLQRAVYTHLDPETLHVEGMPPAGIPPERLLDHLRYAIRPSHAKQAVLELLYAVSLQTALVVGALAFSFYLLFRHLVSNPLHRLARLVRALGSGEETPLARARFPITELEVVRASLQAYHERLQETRRVLDDRNRELWLLAHRDPLTGVLNRRAFDEDWTRADGTSGPAAPMAFLLLDCDHFKAINDTYGHQVGDEVLRRIARGIQHSLRASDRLYRLGGDEFAALLPRCDADCAREVAERCLEHLDGEDFTRLGIHEPVRVSIGIALAEGERLPPLDELKRMADTAMYHAKRPNRHRIQFYSGHMDREGGMLYSSRVLHAVERALNTGEGIEMHYQPVVDLASGRTLYREALVRIRMEGALLAPGRFLPVIEAHRQEVELDLAVLEAIRRDIERGGIPEHEGVSVNVSGMGILRREVMQALERLAAAAGGRALILEITETAYIAQIEQANHQIGAARALGYQIALDDFGSGYSSLRYLATMPFDIVKFDISMTRQLAGGKPQRLLTERMVEMLTEAGYKTVAEGIEDAATLERVRQAGFACAQGYHLGRPAALDAPAQAAPARGRAAVGGNRSEDP